MTDEFVSEGTGRLSHMPEPTTTLDDHPDVHGFDLGEELSASGLLDAMGSIGFQATHLSRALEVVKAMRREGATIFFSFTGNMVSSGVRDLIRYLVEHEYVDALVTNAGGVEEDIIKCFAPFKIGSFTVPGHVLFEKGVHRIGNIFVPTDRYTKLDQWLTPRMDSYFEQHKVVRPLELLKWVGQELDDDSSILTWASRNDIPVFCPGLHDGSFGQLFYFRTHKDKEFVVDIARENKAMIELALGAEKTGAIILGGGISKHWTLLGNIFNDGLQYVVYINTGIEHDGSDSGAATEEAVTWSKIRPDALAVKVWCDATIAFPLLCAGWMSWERSR